MNETGAVQLILSGVAIPLLGYIITEIRSTKGDVRKAIDEVRIQNSRIAKLEQWTTDHELFDTERTDGILKRLDRIQLSFKQEKEIGNMI